MNNKTISLWENQYKHKNCRLELFQAIQDQISAKKVLYPGSYVDVSPSFVYTDVTYVDIDKRAHQFFSDTSGVKDIIGHISGNSNARFRFIHSDYRSLDLQENSFDLLISLYAGFISDACGRFLRKGGTLLVNASHGDAALASLDKRFELISVVDSENDFFTVSDSNLHNFLIPKKPVDNTREHIMKTGKAIPYTNPKFAYLFKKII